MTQTQKLITAAGALAYGLSMLVVVVDQAVKAWILGGSGLAPGFSMPVWGPLRFTLVANRGVSYGFLSNDTAWAPWVLAGFSLVVALALALWARRCEKTMLGLALGLIMGGAVGNLIDRVRLGSVVDFIDVQSLHFPWVFNIADSAITVGITLLILDSLMSSAKRGA